MGTAASSVGWWLLVISLVFVLSRKLKTHLIAQILPSAFIVNCRLFNGRTPIRKK